MITPLPSYTTEITIETKIRGKKYWCWCGHCKENPKNDSSISYQWDGVFSCGGSYPRELTIKLNPNQDEKPKKSKPSFDVHNAHTIFTSPIERKARTQPDFVCNFCKMILSKKKINWEMHKTDKTYHNGVNSSRNAFLHYLQES